jgi:excisionase family DNA binding protein
MIATETEKAVKGSGPASLRRREAAQYLGVCLRTLEGLVRDGQVKAIRVSKWALRFRESDLDRYLDTRYVR